MKKLKMTLTQLNIQYKSQETFNSSLTIAIIVHLVCIYFITIHFNKSPERKTTNIAFLGAILDPFETDKIKTPNYFSVKNTLNPKLENQQHNKNTVTILTKPHLNQDLNQNHKILFKSPPEQKNAVPEIIKNKPITNDEYRFLPQPYQHLKLWP